MNWHLWCYSAAKKIWYETLSDEVLAYTYFEGSEEGVDASECLFYALSSVALSHGDKRDREEESGWTLHSRQHRSGHHYYWGARDRWGNLCTLPPFLHPSLCPSFSSPTFSSSLPSLYSTCVHIHVHVHLSWVLYYYNIYSYRLSSNFSSLLFLLLLLLLLPPGDISKPQEIFHIIEHFCLGQRRLHMFGTDNTIRPGEETPAINNLKGYV